MNDCCAYPYRWLVLKHVFDGKLKLKKKNHLHGSLDSVQADAFLMGKSNLLIQLKPCQNVTVHKLFTSFVIPPRMVGLHDN